MFLGKRKESPPKKQGFLIPTEPLKSLEKKGKKQRWNKKNKSSQGENNKEIPQTRKDRVVWKSGPGSLWWWNLKILRTGGCLFVSIFVRKNSLRISHQNFTTLFTLQFAISKEMCRLVLTLGAISRKEIVILRPYHCDQNYYKINSLRIFPTSLSDVDSPRIVSWLVRLGQRSGNFDTELSWNSC